MKITANTVARYNLTDAAVCALVAVGAADENVAADFARVVADGSGDALLAECIDGADDVAASAWGEYVFALEVAAGI